MRAIIIFILLIAWPIMAEEFMFGVTGYHYADLDNQGGPICPDDTSNQIVQITVSEGYCSMRGVETGQSYQVTSYEMQSINGETFIDLTMVSGGQIYIGYVRLFDVMFVINVDGKIIECYNIRLLQ